MEVPDNNKKALLCANAAVLRNLRKKLVEECSKRHVHTSKRAVKILREHKIIGDNVNDELIDKFILEQIGDDKPEKDVKKFLFNFANAIYAGKPKRHTDKKGNYININNKWKAYNRWFNAMDGDDVYADLISATRFFMYFAEDCTAMASTQDKTRSTDPKDHSQKKNIDIIYMDNFCSNQTGFSEFQPDDKRIKFDDFLDLSCRNILDIVKHKSEREQFKNKKFSLIHNLYGLFGNKTDDPSKNIYTSKTMNKKLLDKYDELLKLDEYKDLNLEIRFVCDPKKVDPKNGIDEKAFYDELTKKHHTKLKIFDYTKNDAFPTNTLDNNVHTIMCHPGDHWVWFGNEHTVDFTEKGKNTANDSAEAFFKYTDFISRVVADEQAQNGKFDADSHVYKIAGVNDVEDFKQKDNIEHVFVGGNNDIKVNLEKTDGKGTAVDCKDLKDPDNTEKTTILTLASDKKNDGAFFKRKNKHWSWWVFPSFTDNIRYNKFFNYSDDSQIYSNIANNAQYLKAYTEVLGQITNEMYASRAKRLFKIMQEIDFIKMITCYKRILPHVESIPAENRTKEQKLFLDQILLFSVCLDRCAPQDFLEQLFRCCNHYYTRYGIQNIQTLMSLKEECQGIEKDRIDQILIDMLCPKELQDKVFSFEVEFPKNADKNVNVSNSCYLHAAIAVLAHMPYLKEALKDYIDNVQDKDTEANKFITALYNYLCSGQQKDFDNLSQSFKHDGEEHDAQEAYQNIVNFLRKHLRIKIFDIFTLCPKRQTLSSLDGQETYSTSWDSMLGENRIQQGDAKKNLKELFDESLKETITDKNNLYDAQFRGRVSYIKNTTVANGCQPPILSVLTFFSPAQKNVKNDKQPPEKYGKEVFNVTDDEKIKINNDLYTPFATVEHFGDTDSGHWVAYGNSITNIDNKQLPRLYNDSLGDSNSGKQNPKINTPNVVLLYNKAFFEKYKGAQYTFKQLITERLKAFPLDFKLKLISLLEQERNQEVQLGIEKQEQNQKTSSFEKDDIIVKEQHSNNIPINDNKNNYIENSFSAYSPIFRKNGVLNDVVQETPDGQEIIMERGGKKLLRNSPVRAPGRTDFNSGTRSPVARQYTNIRNSSNGGVAEIETATSTSTPVINTVNKTPASSRTLTTGSIPGGNQQGGLVSNNYRGQQNSVVAQQQDGKQGRNNAKSTKGICFDVIDPVYVFATIACDGGVVAILAGSAVKNETVAIALISGGAVAILIGTGTLLYEKSKKKKKPQTRLTNLGNVNSKSSLRL